MNPEPSEEEVEAMVNRFSQIAVARSRPVVHDEPLVRITMTILERHVAHLDVMSVLIRLKHKKPLSRAEIVRALVEFMERSEIDFTQFRTSDEMVTFLVEYFEQIPNRGRLPLLLESTLGRREAVRAARSQRRFDAVAPDLKTSMNCQGLR